MRDYPDGNCEWVWRKRRLHLRPIEREHWDVTQRELQGWRTAYFQRIGYNKMCRNGTPNKYLTMASSENYHLLRKLLTDLDTEAFFLVSQHAIRNVSKRRPCLLGNLETACSGHLLERARNTSFCLDHSIALVIATYTLFRIYSFSSVRTFQRSEIWACTVG